MPEKSGRRPEQYYKRAQLIAALPKDYEPEDKTAYAVTREISRLFRIPEQAFYNATKHLLYHKGAAFAVQTIRERLAGTNPGVSPAVLLYVLEHIIARTMPFQKVLELIEVSQIVEGLPLHCLPGIGLDRKTVSKALKLLEQERYIFRIRHNRNDKGQLIGFNILQCLLDAEEAMSTYMLANMHKKGTEEGGRLAGYLKTESRFFSLYYSGLFDSLFEYFEKGTPVVESFHLYAAGVFEEIILTLHEDLERRIVTESGFIQYDENVVKVSEVYNKHKSKTSEERSKLIDQVRKRSLKKQKAKPKKAEETKPAAPDPVQRHEEEDLEIWKRRRKKSKPTPKPAAPDPVQRHEEEDLDAWRTGNR